MMTVSPIKIAIALAVVALLAPTTGCIYEVGIPADGDKQAGELNPIRGMHRQPYFRDQQPQPIFRADQPEGMRYPPPKTVPVDGVLRSDQPSLEASARLVNPVAITQESLDYGRFMYQTACVVCHGEDGKGQGPIVASGAFAPAPPSLTSDRSRAMEDGRIYHVMTYGQGVMWSYKSQLTDLERWAVVNYIRALQRADFPEPADLDRVRQ